MQSPKVSVIIPVYNVEKYLHQCLDSVVNQTLQDIEIICIDDGSTDSSLQILQQYAASDARFIILEQENAGSGSARNNGINVAKGEFLTFINPDDWVDVHMYEEMYSAAIKHDCDAVECDYIEWHEETSEAVQSGNSQRILDKTGVDVKVLDTFNWMDIKEAFFRIAPAVWTRIYKTNFIKENEIDFCLSRRGQDQSFGMDAYFAAKRIHFIDKSFYYYRVIPVAKRFKKSAKYYKDAFLFHEAMQRIFAKHDVYRYIPKAVDEHFAIIFYYLCIGHLPRFYQYKFMWQAKRTLTACQFRMLWRYMHPVSLGKRITRGLECIISFKKKKVDGKTVKVLSIFSVPVKHITKKE